LKSILFLVLIALPVCLKAQGSAIPLGNSAYPIVERLEILTGSAFPGNSSFKWFYRGDVTNFAGSLDTAQLSERDRQDLDFIYRDNNEWLATAEDPVTIAGKKEGVFQQIGTDSLGPIYRKSTPSQMLACEKDARYTRCRKPLLKYFYRTPANFFELNKSFFHLRINPVINLKLAKGNGEAGAQFLAQRGVELRGGIDDRVWFYSNIVDALARFPDYVNDYIQQNRAIPGAAYYKKYESTIFDSSQGYDFLNGQAHLGFNITRHVAVQFGHGRHFIGNGYRSMLLSDFANNYLYLKLDWRFGRLRYQNLFAELAALSAQANPGENLLPKKYMAAHYLSYDLTENLSFGLCEATIFNRDSLNGQFDLQYLNPVILYRTVEQLLNSPDNVLIGLNARWNFLRRFQLYAQLMMDEFKYKELLIDRRGWWANKYGVQAGLKYVNAFGIEHLDLQAEFNAVRPYTYTYADTLGASYSHYSQALAHPSGANFREWVGLLRWQPLQAWTLTGRVIRSTAGEDSNGSNWGGNILIPYTSRVQEYGNQTGQGVGADVTLLGFDLSYELWHNLFLDLHYFYRKKVSDLPERSRNEQFFGGGFRMNIGQWRADF
jgi:hypothetical protein